MNGLPDFIIIGAGKCGTTSLHNYLNQHPQVYICPQKETFFFTDDLTRQKNRVWGAVGDLAAYQALFEAAPPHKTRGEISTVYYAYPPSAQSIYSLIPEVKIIAILRDPANRAFSDYQMHVQSGSENRDFDSLITANNRYVRLGFYYSHLLPFFETCPATNIKILLFEDFRKNPANFLQELFNFIQVDPTFIPDMEVKAREGGLPKNQAVNSLLNKPNPLRTTVATIMKLFIPLDLRQNIRSSLVKKNLAKTKLSPTTRQKLINLYRDDICQLQDLLQRDLSPWLK